MKRMTSAKKSTSRRSFLRNGIVSAGAATLSATVMAKELSALELREEGPGITEGDVAIWMSSGGCRAARPREPFRSAG